MATRLGANQDTSLPFAGKNVPEFVELLDGSGTVMQTLRLIVNQVGTVQAVVDVATGEVVQRLEHDEFGRVLFDSNAGLQPFGFAGGLVDADTGLVRFGARDYQPELGRWTTRDPILFAGAQTNLYAYVNSEPIGVADPRGEKGWGAAAIGGAIGGLVGGVTTWASGGTASQVTAAMVVGAAGGAIGSFATGSLSTAIGAGFGAAGNAVSGGGWGSIIGGAAGGAFGGWVAGLPGGGALAVGVGTWVGGIAAWAGGMAGQGLEDEFAGEPGPCAP